MKKSLVAIACLATLTPVIAEAEAGDWVVRIRAAEVSPNEDSNLGKTVNRNIAPVMTPGAELSVDNNIIPEMDISYYFTKNVAAELILATGTRHDVSVKGDALATVGNQNLGSVNALPPTLTAQWHFNPDQTFDPYVGLGVNYTTMLDRNLQFSKGTLAGNKIKVESDSWGYALQAGLDVNLKDGWLINADIKYLNITTDVKTRLAGNWIKIDSLDINPWVFGIGIGKKF